MAVMAMDEIDAIIMAELLEQVKPEMEKNARILADCVNSAASSTHGSLSGAAKPSGGLDAFGDVINAYVDIESIPRPSLFPHKYAGANIFALFDQGYTVKKPVWFRNIPNFGFRSASNIIDRGISAFKGRDSLGVTLNVVKPNGYI